MVLAAGITYKRLSKVYKYKLLAKYSYLIRDFASYGPVEVKSGEITYITLNSEGLLTIYPEYLWDGPSGPTIDTKTFMRGSLIHDSLYQLIREGYLPQESREYADRILRAVCLQDGMCQFRATYVYYLIRWFGAKAAKPNK